MSKPTLRRLFFVASITSAVAFGACAGEESFDPDPAQADETCDEDCAPCMSAVGKTEFYQDARKRLQGSEDVFDDKLAEVLRIEDLNGDGIEDYIVKPGFSYSAQEGPDANVDQTIYLSNAVGCTDSFAGSMTGSQLTVTIDGAKTSGIRDVQARSILGCVEYIMRYKYDRGETVYGFSSVEQNDLEDCTP